jgi:hypothetical protein
MEAARPREEQALNSGASVWQVRGDQNKEIMKEKEIVKERAHI